MENNTTRTESGNPIQVRKHPVWQLILLDVVMAAAILGVFYLFLNVIPSLRDDDEMSQRVAAAQSARPQLSSAFTAEPDDTQPDPIRTSSRTVETDSAPAAPGRLSKSAHTFRLSSASVRAAITAPNSVKRFSQSAPASAEGSQDSGESTDVSASEDSQSLREKFAEFFTDEVVIGKYDYTSPEVSIHIVKSDDSEHGSADFTYYFADIHVASPEYLMAGFPSGKKTAMADTIAKSNGAILAVNGDFYRNIHKGLLVRNGVVLQESEGTEDLCVLYENGVMETYLPGGYDLEEIVAAQPYQVWSFGPALLDENGDPKEEFNTSASLLKRHPRTAIGYYEPGHYCLVVVDGRLMGSSNGVSMRALSDLMHDLGCVCAYNLDGGDSSSMVFNGKTISKPSRGGRAVSDVVMVFDPYEEEK